jgi:hypothetical protein
VLSFGMDLYHDLIGERERHLHRDATGGKLSLTKALWSDYLIGA